MWDPRLMTMSLAHPGAAHLLGRQGMEGTRDHPGAVYGPGKPAVHPSTQGPCPQGQRQGSFLTTEGTREGGCVQVTCAATLRVTTPLRAFPGACFLLKGNTLIPNRKVRRTPQCWLSRHGTHTEVNDKTRPPPQTGGFQHWPWLLGPGQ